MISVSGKSIDRVSVTVMSKYGEYIHQSTHFLINAHTHCEITSEHFAMDYQQHLHNINIKYYNYHFSMHFNMIHTIQNNIHNTSYHE